MPIEIKALWIDAVIYRSETATTVREAVIEANLSGADLSRADLSGADLSGADLSGADLSGANLSGANLSRADLLWANLSGADLSGANLLWANLSGANLSRANLLWANLSRANLSGATGLLSQSEFMAGFEADADGWIVYKRIGKTTYDAPDAWMIAPGEYLTEVVNANRTDDCGCGVNFATRDWCEREYTTATLWRCRIRWQDGPGIVVPYNTDGKARCERLELLEVVA